MTITVQDCVDILGAVPRAKPTPLAVEPAKKASAKDRAADKPRPYVLIDTREQRPLRFAPELGVDCGAATLPAGDYSVRGFTALIALERKSIGDLVGTLSQGRERFEAELDLLAAYRWKAIIIEADQADIEGHAYRSNMLPKSVIGSLRAFYMRWGVPHFWCTNAAGAAECVAWFARRLHEKHWELADFGEKEQQK
jgi:ERCC4-type nuclease